MDLVVASRSLQLQYCKRFESIEEDESLFYVCCGTRSALLNLIIKNNQKNVTPFHNKDGRKLSSLIEHITKPKKAEKMNLLVDKYDGEDLDESEAKRLNYIFNDLLKKSFIVLIAQLIKKERIINEVAQKKKRITLAN